MPLASHWPELSRLLDEALELPEAERAAWIDRLPPERAALAPTLRRLLLHPDGALPPDWLQSPPPLATSREAEFVPDQRIGPWRLIQELGQGGMGVVWRARRDDGELGRDAALKLPHAHLLAGDLRGRFARERDILASLSHPNIATLYDARLAEGGQPWLALELVEGRNIVDACRERQLDVPARLRWFDQVLDAIRYAHSRLVVHRDLKPSNVLVDATGRVKLLDFGIAKLLSADGKDADALTRAGTLAVTPAYAAPEQLAGGEVTTATDVYALGVLLFELLSGRRPFDGPRTSGREAPRASDCADDPATRRALRGDLDAILARALALRPDDRYPTADALHADLARARRDEPVEARHIGALQLAGKFLRRHRTAAAFSGLLIAVVAAGVAGVFWQAREARQQARRAEAVTAFLTSVFAASDPRIASDTPRGQITARQLLDLGVPRIEAGFADDPRTQIELLRAVADIYRALDEHERADALQERQLALVRRLYGPHHPNVLDHAVELGSRACGAADAASCAIAQRDADARLRAA
ncbi:MAG: serine/threonine-protein kinase, partial [Steroidobacteraceae bacterium]